MTDNILPFNDKIAKRIDVAIENKNVELEAIIDKKIVNRKSFIDVREYLENSPFYRHLHDGNPEVSLDIHTKFTKNLLNGKEYVSNSFERATIKGQMNVQKYCKTNKINRIEPENLEFLKKNGGEDKSEEGPRKVYFKNPWPSREDREKGESPYFKYRVNIKSEEELSTKKDSDGKSRQDKFIRRIYNYDKSFRYKCRWSFIFGRDESQLFRVDCTAVKSSKFNEYYPTFKESNTLGQPEEYEIEIEYIGNNVTKLDLSPIDESEKISPESPIEPLAPKKSTSKTDRSSAEKEDIDIKYDINKENIHEYIGDTKIYNYNVNDAIQVTIAEKIEALGYEVKPIGPTSPDEEPPPRPIYRYIPNTRDYLRALHLQDKGYDIMPRDPGTYTIDEDLIPTSELPKPIRPILRKKKGDEKSPTVQLLSRARGAWKGSPKKDIFSLPAWDTGKEYKPPVFHFMAGESGLKKIGEDPYDEYEEISDSDSEEVSAPPEDSTKHIYNILNNILESILKIVYNTSYLISDKERHDVHEGYKTVTGQLTKKYINFIGPQPVSMSIEHIVSGTHPNIKDNEYLVTEKADGDRYLLYIHSNGVGYMYNNKHRVNEIISTGIIFPEEYQSWIFDGEYITSLEDGTPTKRFYIFDVYYHTENSKKIQTFNRLWTDAVTRDSEPIPGRVKYIDRFIEHIESRDDISVHAIKIYKKNYQYVAGNSFEAARIKLGQIDSKEKMGISLCPYKTDGLVFMPLKFPVNGMTTAEVVNPNIKLGGKPFLPEELIRDEKMIPIGEIEKNKSLKVIYDKYTNDNEEYLQEVSDYYKQATIVDNSINSIGGTWFANFKWKPPHLNTIDFAINIDHEVHQMIDPDDNSNILKYKNVSLLVFYDQNNDADIDFIKKTYEYPYGMKKSYKKTILFNPDDTDTPLGKTSILLENNKLLCLEDKDEIKGDTIVEFSYDASKPDGFKWVPLRLRKDKAKAQPSSIANNIWRTIINPITKDMISRGLTEKETSEVIVDVKKDNKYYNATINRDASVIRAQAKYHNDIKRKLIVSVCNLVKSTKDADPVVKFGESGVAILDLAVGRGGDISKFLDEDTSVEKILGIDLSPGNIEECCSRWWTTPKWQKKDVLGMYFAGDTSKNIKNGEIAEDDPEKIELLGHIYGNASINILPSIPIDDAFYLFAADGMFMKKHSKKQIERYEDSEEYIKESTVNVLAQLGKNEDPSIMKTQLHIRKNMVLADSIFDIANMQFAVHYFFENPQKLDGLLKNIDENLVNGGYFIGTCFDGERVMEYLEDIKQGKEKAYTVGDYKAIAIRKDYSISKEDFVWDPEAADSAKEITSREPFMYGKQISVFQETFGDYYPEYLVNFEYFKWKCAQYDLYPLESVSFDEVEKDEYNKILTLSMGNFSEFYNDYLSKNGGEMEPELQDLSFLNRIFIFKKVLPEEPTAEDYAFKIQADKLDKREGLLNKRIAFDALQDPKKSVSQYSPPPPEEASSDAEITKTETGWLCEDGDTRWTRTTGPFATWSKESE